MTTSMTTPKFYVGTYSKYNEGNLFGEWLDLSDYSDADEFLTACRELHQDEESPELMFQDYEGLPKFLYGESLSVKEIENIYTVIDILVKVADFDDSDWIGLHNEYCQNNQIEDEIHNFDEDFFDVFFNGKPMEAARATSFGDVNWSDDYIMFNGYGNLETIGSHSIESHLDKDAILQDICDNPRNYSL